MLAESTALKEMNSSPNRRELLTGRAALRAVQQLGDSSLLADRASSSVVPPPSYLMEISRDAMATEFQVLLNAERSESRVEAAVEALDCIERWEEMLSVFRVASDISRINRASNKPVQVSHKLFELLQQCVSIHGEVHRAFDITASPLWRLWGFHRRQGGFPGSDQIKEALRSVGSEKIELDESSFTIRLSIPGMELNMGAIGKGFALDEAADIMRAKGVDNFLIHGGGSSVLSMGNRNPSDGLGWTIGVRHPLRVDRRVGEIRLLDRAVGTSGSANQFFYHNERRLSHIIDPRTGWPADQVLGATALAPTAAMADALSTAFFVLRPDETLAYCREHADVAAILILGGNKVGELQFVTANVTSSEWNPIES